MIEVQSLTKTYDQRVAVDDISFSVKKGEILGFLGPNGAGKSTTMKMISGFIPLSSGRINVNGFDVSQEPLKAKASIGYLPENPPVYMGMEVQSYLEFAAQLHGVHKTKLKSAVNDAMEKCGITSVRQRIIGNLSKGFRQRVGLAQAIAHNPAVLILDEPTVGLDPRQIIDIRNLIKSFEGNHTVILSTHILPEVQAACSRVVVIDRGKVVAEDTLNGIAARMQSSMRISVSCRKDPQDIFSQLKALSGAVSVNTREQKGSEFSFTLECSKGADLRADVAKLLVQSGKELLALHQETLSLEDAFVKLVTHEPTAEWEERA